MLSLGDREAIRRSLYNGTWASRLCASGRVFAAIVVTVGTLSMAGCAYQLETMFGKDGDTEDQPTGSIGTPGRQTASVRAELPSEADLAYARAVVAEALSRGSKDNSIPWENPNTGAGGNITPLAAAYNDGAATCRDFLASYVRGQAQSWLQGAACRTAQGKWEVKSLKPMKQG